MNKINKFCFPLIIFGVGCVLIGCNLITNIGENTTETINSIVSTSAEAFEKCTDDEYEKVFQDVDIIIHALNNKDSEQLKSVLTDVALQESPNLDEEIQCVFDMLDGEIVEVKKNDVHYNEEYLYGEKRHVIYMYYDVATKDNEYILDILYIPEKDNNFNKAGVFSVLLGGYNRDYQDYIAIYPVLHAVSGVFSSDIETIRYNEAIIAEFYKEFGFEEFSETVSMELNKVGIEEIVSLEMVKKFDFGGIDYILTDSVNNKYYISTNEDGLTFQVLENDAKGKMVYSFY